MDSRDIVIDNPATARRQPGDNRGASAAHGMLHGRGMIGRCNLDVRKARLEIANHGTEEWLI
jgi:hypothetical protein